MSHRIIDTYWAYDNEGQLYYESRTYRFQVDLSGFTEHTEATQRLVADVAAFELTRIARNPAPDFLERAWRASLDGLYTFALDVAERRIAWCAQDRYGLRPSFPIIITAIH